MFTTIVEPKPPSEIHLELQGRTERLVQAGPGSYGWIYSPQSGSFIYRLIPIDDAPLQSRSAVGQWVDKEQGDGISTITKAWQPDDNPGYFIVQYRVDQPGISLADAIADPDPKVRVEHMTKVLRAFPHWWDNLYAPILPMPLDIILTKKGNPYILHLPNWGLPRVRAIIVEPERALYLSPELVRGNVSIEDNKACRNVDRYTLGVQLLQCFYRIPEARDAGSILPQVASGTIFSPRNLTSQLPYWYERVSVTQSVIEAMHRMVSSNVDTRIGIDLGKLTDLLDDWCEHIDPKVAAIELRDNGKPREAFALLQDILLSQESPELLILAGEIAAQYLNSPLEATDLFERAIAKAQHIPAAYEGQFKAIVAGRRSTQMRRLVEMESQACEQIDGRIWRDYQNMSTSKQESYELDMANYLIWRKHYDKAAGFIHPKLFRGEKYLWWKFGMNLAYAECLIEQGKSDDGMAQLNYIERRLKEARKQRNITDGEYHQHMQILAGLRAKVMDSGKGHIGGYSG
jgi:hypothetical protein